ncbi:MAG: outer membrane lipoprotein chaperone LolA [Granulosicoccus sp.]
MHVLNSRHNRSSAASVSCSDAAARRAGVVFLCGSLLLLMILFLSPRLSVADEADVEPVKMLEKFIKSLDSFEASFEQTLYTSDSDDLGTSVGTIKLKRPARFIWTYTSPEPQVITADGERIWLYDEDLEQVTVNAIDERINGTPLQLLMSAAPLSDAFDIESLGQSDGIEWFALTPLTQSSDFEQVFIGLKDDAIAAIELSDSFGQATQIRLSDFRQGVEFDDSLFVFEVPEGVDVIGLDE